MIGKRDEQKKQVSLRLTEKEYAEFKRQCHMEFSEMATIARKLALEWMEKNRKNMK